MPVGVGGDGNGSYNVLVVLSCGGMGGRRDGRREDRPHPGGTAVNPRGREKRGYMKNHRQADVVSTLLAFVCGGDPACGLGHLFSLCCWQGVSVRSSKARGIPACRSLRGVNSPLKRSNGLPFRAVVWSKRGERVEIWDSGKGAGRGMLRDDPGCERLAGLGCLLTVTFAVRGGARDLLACLVLPPRNPVREMLRGGIRRRTLGVAPALNFTRRRPRQSFAGGTLTAMLCYLLHCF